IYLSYSKGFKGGGFDPRGQTSAAPDIDEDGDVDFDDQYEFLSFEPETVDSYELGWKASLLDNRLNIALAGFIGQYKDVQIPGSIGFDSDGDGVNDSFIGVTTNAASADINGIEFEGNALVGRDFAGPGSRLTFNWSLGYLDAGFNEYIDNFGNDVADQRVIQNTPEFTVHSGFDIGIPVGGGIIDFLGSITVRSDTSQFELPGPLDQDGYELVDLGLVYTDDSDRFTIGVHAKNIFDQRYIVSGYDFVTGTVLGLEGNLTAFYGDPRRVFVTGEVKF
ncbi:MAG: TonB-dependent receptor, partial [Erythrobacter sp.]|nr:TonB-dependent receptor [Erythrobacter sp.]